MIRRCFVPVFVLGLVVLTLTFCTGYVSASNSVDTTEQADATATPPGDTGGAEAPSDTADDPFAGVSCATLQSWYNANWEKMMFYLAIGNRPMADKMFDNLHFI